MTQPTEIAVGWHSLESGSVRKSDLSVPSWSTGFDVGHGAIRLALTDEGNRRLLIPIPADAAVVPRRPTESLQIDSTYLLDKTGRIRFLDVRCLDSALNPAFSGVVDEVLRNLGEGLQPIDAVEQAVQNFRELLRLPRAVPFETVLGVLGELSLLIDLLGLDPAALRAWTGPAGTRHDFVRGASSIEVKSSIKRSSRTIEITSLEQLLEPEGGELHLAHIIFELVPEGENIVQLIARAESAGADRKHLVDLLSDMGIDPHEESIMSVKVRRISVTLYRVDAQFPRIIATNFRTGALPAGIRTIRYVVDLDVADQSRLDNEEAEKAKRRFLAC